MVFAELAAFPFGAGVCCCFCPLLLLAEDASADFAAFLLVLLFDFCAGVLEAAFFLGLVAPALARPRFLPDGNDETGASAAERVRERVVSTTVIAMSAGLSNRAHAGDRGHAQLQTITVSNTHATSRDGVL